MESEWQGETNILAHKNLFFVDAAAGTDNTFLYNTLISSIRGRNEIVAAYALGGNAASLFFGGRTLHSTCKIPLELNKTSVCGLKCNHKYSEYIKNARLIIIDEVSMWPLYVLNVTNKFSKELMRNNQHLGGGMNCVTASYAGVAGFSPTGKEQKFVPFSFIHNPPLSLFISFCELSAILLTTIWWQIN